MEDRLAAGYPFQVPRAAVVLLVVEVDHRGVPVRVLQERLGDEAGDEAGLAVDVDYHGSRGAHPRDILARGAREDLAGATDDVVFIPLEADAVTDHSKFEMLRGTFRQKFFESALPLFSMSTHSRRLLEPKCWHNIFHTYFERPDSYPNVFPNDKLILSRPGSIALQPQSC